MPYGEGTRLPLSPRQPLPARGENDTSQHVLGSCDPPEHLNDRVISSRQEPADGAGPLPPPQKCSLNVALCLLGHETFTAFLSFLTSSKCRREGHGALSASDIHNFEFYSE